MKFLLAALVLLSVLTAGVQAAPLFTTSHYDAVNLGDDHAHVTAVLGAPTEINYESGSEICYIWEGDGGTIITVTYQHGYVISKWEVGLEPPFHAL